MGTISYKVARHDGGWAYEVNGTYSEKFPTREAARKAAKLAASEQVTPAGDNYGHDQAHRQDEIADGRDEEM